MDIYEPAEDSFLLQKYVRKYSLGRVLDLGTGLGLQALTAIKNPQVREVVAVDINKEAVKSLQKKIKEKGLKKLTILCSNLFDKINGKFNVILFNPPYLPQDKWIEDSSLYGGKKGWEISARFFQEVSPYLVHNGKIIFLFSSLTNKKKIDEIITHHLLEFKLLEKKKLPFFEELFVYEISKSKLLRDLERRGIKQIEYFAKGKRGFIFVGFLNHSKSIKSYLPLRSHLVKVAVKVQQKETAAQNRISNEAFWLPRLNAKGIGPKYLFQEQDYVVYHFVEGEYILKWISQHNSIEIKELLVKILRQCRILDQMNVTKEEMHHPLKHILVDPLGNPVLIDFERCKKTIHPQNVTQFLEFISRTKLELKKKKVVLDLHLIRKFAQEYKKELSSKIFTKIINKLISEH